MASRYADAPQGPGKLDVAGFDREISLTESARAAVAEGCVGETIAALVAREQRARAADPAVVQALGHIAEDEERHAALAWRFVRWAIARGGDSVRRAVRESFRSAVANARRAPVEGFDVRDRDAWHRHGRLDHDETVAVTRAALDEVIVPCAEALLADPPVLAESAVA